MVYELEFVLLGDEGVELNGTDTAPGAVEEMMYALGTCIIAAGNANAALMGVELTQFDVDLESDLDVRPGVLELRANITISGDAEPSTLREIANLGLQYSPVSESLQHGINVVPKVEVKQ